MARQRAAKARELEPARSEVATLLRAPVAAAASSLARKVHIGQLLADAGAIGKLGVGQVVLGDTTIKKVVLQNTSASVQGGKALLQNVRINLELQFRLDWRVGVRVLGHNFSWNGSENLGSLWFPLPVGDVQIPSLQNINVQIPTMTASGIKATLPPISGLALGAASFKKLEAVNTDLPADGFDVNGLGFGTLQLSDVQVPKTLTESAKLAELRLQGDVVLPGAEVANLQLPAAAAGNIASQPFSFDAVPARRAISADFGILDVTLSVQPIAHTSVDAMLIQDVKLAAAVGKLKIEEIRVPVTILGVTLQQIALEGVKIAKVSL